MGGFINNLIDKLKEVVSPGDELVSEQTRSQSPAATPTPPVKEADNNSGPPQLIAGTDYYMEGPYMVMTAKYLKKRGYCCESGCRHCPYGFNRKKNSEQNSDNLLKNIDNTDKSSEQTGPQ